MSEDGVRPIGAAEKAARTTADRAFTRIVTIAAIAAGVLLIIFAMLRLPPIQNANDESRWSTVWSLVERGTYVIDESPWVRTVDKIRRDGHFYSSKPPLMPTLVAGGYAVLKSLTGWTLESNTREVVTTLLILMNVVPFAVFVALYARFLRDLAVARRTFAACMIAAALGTFLTPYCVTMNNHAIAGFVCFFVAYLVWRLSERTDALRMAVAGLLAGLLPSLDFLAAPFCVCVFAWLLVRDWRMTLAVFVPAALVPIAAFFVTNWFVMDGFLPAYAYKHTELYAYGPDSFWSKPRGIAANTDSTLLYAVHVLLGHHGWFSHTPIWLLALAGMLRRAGNGIVRVAAQSTPDLRLSSASAGAVAGEEATAAAEASQACGAASAASGPRHATVPIKTPLPGRLRTTKAGVRRLGTVSGSLRLFVLANFVAVVLFYVLNKSRDYGGTCQGFRWLYWMIPLWLMALPTALDGLWKRRWRALIACAALAVSVFSSLYALSSPWGTSWIHALMRRWGWVAY